LEFEICPRKTLTFLIACNIALLLANCIVLFLKLYLDHDYVYGLVHLFDLSKESNIPSYYSAVLHLVAAFSLAFITLVNRKSDKPFSLAWVSLAAAFLFLSYDEIASVHEAVGEVVDSSFQTSGYFYFSWVIPYAIGTALLGLLYVPFLLALPKKIRILFVVSGTVFVGAALGFEMFEAVRVEAYGRDDVIYAILYSIEEFLEMMGVSLFIYALQLYISMEYKHFVVSVKTPQW